MPSAISSPAEITSSENLPGPELQVSDEVFAQIAAGITSFGLAAAGAKGA
jgi:hypothetical protein